MSFLAKLMLDGEEFNVISCRHKTTQGTNENGMPSSKIRGGKISILVESNMKIDFYEWATSSSATKNGEIIFFKRDNISSLKTLEFVDAYCVEHIESFDAVNDQPLTIEMVLSAREITIRGTSHSNNWPSRR